MAKLADAPDLGSGAARRVGSTPIIRTKGQSECEFNYEPFALAFYSHANSLSLFFIRLLFIKLTGISVVPDFRKSCMFYQ